MTRESHLLRSHDLSKVVYIEGTNANAWMRMLAVKIRKMWTIANGTFASVFGSRFNASTLMKRSKKTHVQWMKIQRECLIKREKKRINKHEYPKICTHCRLVYIHCKKFFKHLDTFLFEFSDLDVKKISESFSESSEKYVQKLKCVCKKATEVSVSFFYNIARIFFESNSPCIMEGRSLILAFSKKWGKS